MTRQNGAPQDCDACREHRYREGELPSPDEDDDDFGCWYGTCPWEELQEDQDVLDLYSFCFMAMASHEEEDSFTKAKKLRWAIEIEKFEFACRNYGVVLPEERRAALTFVGYIARLCTEAPEHYVEAETLRLQQRSGVDQAAVLDQVGDEGSDG